MLLMLRWRISKAWLSSTLMILTTCPGILLDSVRSSTLGPDSLASTSATAELQQAPSSLTTPRLPPPPPPSEGLLLDAVRGDGVSWWPCLSCCGRGLGLGLGLRLLRFFLASSDCTSCCSSLMNSMAPPMIEAWSPLMTPSTTHAHRHFTSYKHRDGARHKN